MHMLGPGSGQVLSMPLLPWPLTSRPSSGTTVRPLHMRMHMGAEQGVGR